MKRYQILNGIKDTFLVMLVVYLFLESISKSKRLYLGALNLDYLLYIVLILGLVSLGINNFQEKNKPDITPLWIFVLSLIGGILVYLDLYKGENKIVLISLLTFCLFFSIGLIQTIHKNGAKH